MQQAINEALKADPNKVYPNPLVGCVIVKNDKIIGRGHHKAFGTNHAEVNAIESLKTPVRDADLYVTLEPCQMCAGALYWSRISKIYFGAEDPKRGFKKLGTKLHPKTKVYGGILQNECKDILEKFFISRRNLN